MTAEAELKSEFQNVSDGTYGYVYIDDDGKRQGGGCPPNGTFWLTRREQILTANAHKSAEDNPFTNGTFKLITKGGDESQRRPIGDDQEVQPAEEPEPAPEPTAAEEETSPAAPEAPEASRVPPTPPDRTAAEKAKAEAQQKQPVKAPEQAKPATQKAEAPQGSRAAKEEVATPAATG